MTASSPTRSSAAAAGRPRCWPRWRPRWRPQVPDPQAAGDMYPLTELLSGATERTVLAEAPGKSGATLERMVIGGQDYGLKQLDLAARGLQPADRGRRPPPPGRRPRGRLRPADARRHAVAGPGHRFPGPARRAGNRVRSRRRAPT